MRDGSAPMLPRGDRQVAPAEFEHATANRDREPRPRPRTATANRDRGYGFATALLLAVVSAPRLFSAEEEENQELLFARLLVQRNWSVAAERVIERGLTEAKGQDKLRFRILSLEMALRGAGSLAGAQARADGFKAALLILDELLPAGGGATLSGQAQNEFGELLLSSASLVAAEGRRQSEAAKGAEFQKRALGMLEAAERLFAVRLDVAQKESLKASQAGGEGAEDEEGQTPVSREERDSAYNGAQVLYERALILDGKEREEALRATIVKLEEFQATYDRSLLAFNASIAVGRCQLELGDGRKAAGAFEGAASLLEEFRDDHGVAVVDNPLAADIIQRGLYFKAQALNRGTRAQDFKDALDAVARALKQFPEMRRRPIGYAIRVEGARALSKLGKYREAQSEAQKVVTEDPQGSGGQAAREFLSEIASRIDSGSGGGIVAAIESFIARQEHQKAINAGRQFLARQTNGSQNGGTAKAGAKGHEDPVPPVLLVLAQAYIESDRHQEAALLCEELQARHADHKLAPQALFLAINQRLQAFTKMGSKLDEERKDRNLKLLLDRYGKSSEAGAVQFLRAEETKEKGDLAEAEKLYLAVPENAGRYNDTAKYQAGMCAHVLGARAKKVDDAKAQYARAERHFQDVIKLASEEKEKSGKPIDLDRMQHRKKLRVAARIKLADILASSAYKKYAEALEVLEEIGREDEPTAADLGLQFQTKVRALSALGRIDDAIQAFRQLKERYPNVPVIPQLCREIAFAFEDEAKKLQKTSPEDYKKAIDLALEYYDQWLVESRRLRVPIQASTATRTADRALAYALELSGLPEGRDSFADSLDRADLPQEVWERAVRLLEESKPQQKAGEWVPLARLGRAYGFAAQWDATQWPKASKVLEEALVRGGLLAAVNETNPKPRFEALDKAPDLLDHLIDMGLAELFSAKKPAVSRAHWILSAAAEKADRGSSQMWKCRYGLARAEFLLGNYDKVDGYLENWNQASPEWEGNRYGLKARFDGLRAEVSAKLGKAGSKPKAAKK